MTARYLLDSNVLSEPIRPRPDPRVLSRIEEHEGQLATAATVWSELVFGAERLPPSRRRDRVEEYLAGLAASTLDILPYDVAAAAWHGRERARVEAAGTPRPFADGQIAAVAHRFDLVLVTRNVRDFAPFHGLQVEDWFAQEP